MSESTLARFQTTLLSWPTGMHTHCLIVELETSDGAAGFGYVKSARPGQIKAVKMLADDLLEELVGQDVAGPAGVWQRMYDQCFSPGYRGVSLHAMAAVDMAVWDLFGQHAGLPLYRLLGGCRERIRAYGSHRLQRRLSTDGLAEAARQIVSEGFDAMKMRVGSGTPAEDIDRVRTVREAVGPSVDLMVDVNWLWSAGQTVRVAKHFEPYDLMWLEDPVAESDVAGLRHIRASLRMPITTGERLTSADQFRDFLEARAVDVIMIDLQNVGGITPWLRIASLAQAFEVPVASHVYPDFSSHLLCAIPNALILEYFPHWNLLYREPPRIEGGFAIPPDRPGLGLELDRATIQRYRAE
jgi:L-alanine-DL-glutamate epimerase-like enolase superfamily enzyme